MSEDSELMAAYKSAIKKHEDAYATLKRYVDAIVDAAEKLKYGGWAKVVMSGWRDSYPPELMASKYPTTIEGKNLPSSEQLNDSLIAWHQSGFEVNEAREALPAPDRDILRKAVSQNPPIEGQA